MNYQSLSNETVQKILNAWQTNGGHLGRWEVLEKGVNEYITHSVTDITRLFFEKQETFIKNFGASVRIANSYADSTEEVPSVNIQIGAGRTFIPHIGQTQTSSDLNENISISWEGEITWIVEGRNIKECELLKDRLDSGIIVHFFQAFNLLPYPIVAQKQITTSQFGVADELSKDVKIITRQLTLAASVFDMSLNFIIDSPIPNNIVII